MGRMEFLESNDDLFFSCGEDFIPIRFFTKLSLGSFPDIKAARKLSVGSVPKELKISILGPGGVGKSALTLQFVRDYFVEIWDATIEDSYTKTIIMNDEKVVLNILDTAGQDDFYELRPSWMRRDVLV